jgi:hypothetical protein
MALTRANRQKIATPQKEVAYNLTSCIGGENNVFDTSVANMM